MSEVLEKKWYVVRAVSGQEHKVKGYIESEVERQGLGEKGTERVYTYIYVYI